MSMMGVPRSVVVRRDRDRAGSSLMEHPVVQGAKIHRTAVQSR